MVLPENNLIDCQKWIFCIKTQYNYAYVSVLVLMTIKKKKKLVEGEMLANYWPLSYLPDVRRKRSCLTIQKTNLHVFINLFNH